VAWYVRRRWIRTLAVVLFAVVPLLVAFGRLYRGAHHPSDILAAYLNGGVCLAIAAGLVLARGPLARLSQGLDGGGRDPQPAPVPAGAR
jgi:membrane-associated phospholipid phosphatase